MTLARRLVAEGLGTALLLAVVVGSGIMAERLAGGNVAIALLANTIATGAGLVALILMFGTISGAHFNPAVTLSEAWQKNLPRREVLPYTSDAWIKEDAAKIGYEVSFTRHFYKPQPLRTLEEISADILAVEKEAEGLLGEIISGSNA